MSSTIVENRSRGRPRVGTLSFCEVFAIKAGGTASSHSLATKSDGSLWAWGSNYHGQLGDGTTIDRHSPIRIGSDTNWQSIQTVGSYSLATKSDGTLWAWGRNYNGQLGDGTTIDRHSPVQIGSENDWQSIAAGSGHSMCACVCVRVCVCVCVCVLRARMYV